MSASVIPIKVAGQLIRQKNIISSECKDLEKKDRFVPKAELDVQSRLDKIALLAHGIIDERSNDQFQQVFSSIKHLMDIIAEKVTNNNQIVIQAAYSCLFEIFLSLIPEERKFRERSEKELSQQMKKETKDKLQKESNLITYYTKFINSAFLVLKTPIDTTTSVNGINIECKQHYSLMHRITINGFCSLIKHNCQFNCHEKLINYILNLLNQPGKKTNKKNERNANILSVISCIIENDSHYDKSLHNTLVILQAINRIMKKHDFKDIPDQIFDILFSFNIEYFHSALENVDIKEEVENDLFSKKNMKKKNASKKMIKLTKKASKRHKDLKLAQAKHDQTTKKRNLIKITEIIFFIFFKYVRQTDLWMKNEYKIKLSLQGLARYSHLLNVDFFDEIIQLLKNIIGHETPDIHVQHTLTLLKLQGLHTFFSLLIKFNDSVIIDYSSFYISLLKILISLDFISSGNQCTAIEDIITQIVSCLYSKDFFTAQRQSFVSNIKFIHQITLVLYNHIFMQYNGIFKRCHPIICEFLSTMDLYDILYDTSDNSTVSPFINTMNSAHMTSDQKKFMMHCSSNIYSISLLQKQV